MSEPSKLPGILKYKGREVSSPILKVRRTFGSKLSLNKKLMNMSLPHFSLRNVLVLGATGQLGSRLIPALIAKNCTVTTIVRNPAKLDCLIPNHLLSKITAIEGDANDSALIAQVLCDQKIVFLINTAGHALMLPGRHNFLRDIVQASIDAVRLAASESRQRTRAWFVGGMLLLDLPKTKPRSTLGDYLPFYIHHCAIEPLLRAADHMDWSILCPARMTPLSHSVLDADEHAKLQLERLSLTASTTIPPSWPISWLRQVPLIGKSMEVLVNSGRYTVTYEDVAEFLARDVCENDSSFFEHRVGLVT